MRRIWRKRFTLRNQRGFTLIELMIVVALVGVLVAIAIPLYANIQARARIAKAQADVRTLAEAVTTYSSHVGIIPSALTQLTATAGDPDGVTAGPFVAAIPTQPAGWVAYGYSSAGGAFTVSAAGDGTTASAP